ncbi:Odorant receptor 46a, isoform A [Trachymyrmex zeteki]|uniref:Odorant receptor 46a, isoform A n=1 Tax=Mycetomoellerius zeteki TaxID=64791 RepID=A0A151XK39_9HYME|nr:Odorant receptor 46a, isoform A [Trachymyrmex zeteki]
MIVIAWTFMTLMSLLTNFRHRRLTYRGWIPYDYSSYIKFCLTYGQQLLSTFHGASVNIAGDTLLFGLLMHICCQIEILEYRLKKHLCDQFSLGYCIRHHNRIFEFAQMVNTRFTQIIGFQFMASTMVTCFNLYQLTKSTLNVDHFALIMYTCATLIQIFVYCWNNTLRYIILVGTTCTFVVSSSLFTNFRHKKLNYREWIPFDNSSYIVFCFAYAQQMLSACHAAVVNVAIDSLMCGFLMHICCQIEILEYRLKKSNTLRYSILIASSWTFMSLMSLLTDFKHRKLTYREWVPYDYSSYMMFCITYVHQILSTFYCASVNVACDTLICGFLMHVYCQIEILEYRLKKILCDQSILDYCVHHHNSIFQFAYSVNAKFSQIIGLQFIISTLIICSNLYQLSQSSLNADSIGLIGFTCCMLTEIFLYCWFGHKIKLKSVQVADSIFQIKWPLLNNSVKSNLLIIMKRTTVPIEFTTAHIVSLNLDSFVAVIMNIILNINNFGEISDNIYMTLTVFIATYKITTMWIIKEHVITIINVLTEEPFKPSELCEIIIRQKYDKTIKKYAIWYYGLVQVTVICIILNAIFMDFIEGNLTYKAWVPFDYTSSIIFLLVFTHQMIGMSICAVVNVACDSLVSGLLQEICCQFEILEYRLTKILHETHIRDCVRHHNRIYEYAHIINRRFAKIIALQFAVSMLVVCANLYKLAAISLLMMNGSLVTLLLYTACMLSQIFLYCWFGNELKLKSTGVANSIYNMKWQELDNESTKSLLLIMRRSMIPIEFNSVIVITLNLDSFVAVSIS